MELSLKTMLKTVNQFEPILGTIKRGLRIDLSLKIDGQTNTCDSGKNTRLTIRPIPVTQGQIEIGATGKKKTCAFWSW